MDGKEIVLGCGNFGGIGSDLSLVGKGESDDQAFAIMEEMGDKIDPHLLQAFRPIAFGHY